ncbi:MAG: efflux RND transporter periplasmic adaptor subunit [Hydrogenophilales bacterium]|nr:efflux RND transporter periplasmic adaptor subunit [Hydrogenophilales bacterium]
MPSTPFAPHVRPRRAFARGLILVPCCALLLAACEKEVPKPQRPAPEVTVITVTPRTIPFSSTFVAQTESSRQVNIVARVSGFLEKIAYQEGDLVKEGQILFQIDPKPFQAQLAAARAALAQQEARLQTARQNLARVKPLAAQNALSQKDLDDAVGQEQAAAASVEAAKAQVIEAELNLGYTTIRSPVTGVAGRALQREGAYLNAQAESAQLTYVAALDPIWVNYSVSQNQMAKTRDMLDKGQVIFPKSQDFDVELVLPSGQPYGRKGKINFADPSFSQDTGSFMVRASLPNPRGELRPGMFATAIMKGAVRPDAIVIPQLAVQQGSNGHLVYVIKQDGTAEVRPVVVGDYEGDKDIVIVNGLRAGDRVVVDGVLKVAPGKPVKIVEPGSVPDQPAAKPAAAAKK